MAEDTNVRLVTQIDDDLKQAMRAQDEVTKLVLRSVKTALTEAAKASGTPEQDDAAVMAVLQKEAKRRRDAASEYARLGAPDRAAQEEAELAVLERYLPRQLSEAEIEEIAQRVIAETGASSPRDLGQVMPKMMEQVKGRADGKQVSQVVRRLLT